MVEIWEERQALREKGQTAIRVPGVLNSQFNAAICIDTGNETQSMTSEALVNKFHLQRVKLSKPTTIGSWKDGDPGQEVTEICRYRLDIGGFMEEHVSYVVPDLDVDVLIGTPWMKRLNVVIDVGEGNITFKDSRVKVPSIENLPKLDMRQLAAAGFRVAARKARQQSQEFVFAASIRDIEKALAKLTPKPWVDPAEDERLPKWIDKENLQVFDKKALYAEKLPPHRTGVDHKIELTVPEKDAPWGPLYNMSREELIVLRRTLNDLLDKGFIRVSNSPAAAPVLFARKPGGGLRFCVDYRALNNITRKDRYPLPRIQETLNRICKAKFFTKLDVVAAFHSVRVQPGDEWKTAFRTRFGLYEWLVTPFGLANAPSTFQRFINWTLRDYLDEFASAYVDDILIFTESNNRKLHRQQVNQVLQKLRQAGLTVDIDKCEFEVGQTKYLGFILQQGHIGMDPEKVQAIKEWEAPTTVKGVQGFLGFANFYRAFIRNYSEISLPLTELTKKENPFKWTQEAQAAFEKLKKIFLKEPVLTSFDPEKESIIETDASGYAIGAVHMQYDEDGHLHPCAFFSKKMIPAECNYQIYDKELLAIVKALEHWRAELQGKKFLIVTDHKNLEYFTTTRKLSERQVRWAELLSQFDFEITYRPGKQAVVPDALSRRDQDMPIDGDSRLERRNDKIFDQHKDRLKLRTSSHDVTSEVVGVRLGPILDDVTSEVVGVRLGPIPDSTTTTAGDSTTTSFELPTPFADNTLSQRWAEGIHEDGDFEQVVKTIRGSARSWPEGLKTKYKAIQLGECNLDLEGRPTFRGRLWLPSHEPLTTQVLQTIHDSPATLHPGKNAMNKVIQQQWFWPNYTVDISRFLRNCTTCGSTNIWREKKHGLLKPLPVPERTWREIGIDFIGPFPRSEMDGKTYVRVMVIVDRLSKGILLVPMESQSIEEMAALFLKRFFPLHGLPEAIVGDRELTAAFWARFCDMVGIQKRISTAYHPQTDGSTERANADIKKLLTRCVSEELDNWAEKLPQVEFAFNAMPSSSTGFSPFFLGHGYHPEAIQLARDARTTHDERSPAQRGETVAKKLVDCAKEAEEALYLARINMEDQANKKRSPAPRYQVGDQVWLRLSNLRQGQGFGHKLRDRQGKYTITEKLSGHNYRLDIPGNAHNVFHVDLLHKAGDDPLPSQQQVEYRPPPVDVDGEIEWEVQAIEKRKNRKPKGKGKGKGKAIPGFQVKWAGSYGTTWEPRDVVKDVAALDVFLDKEKELGRFIGDTPKDHNTPGDI